MRYLVRSVIVPDFGRVNTMQRHTEVIRETSERITIRYRKVSRTAYCSSCGKATTWIDAADVEQSVVAYRRRDVDGGEAVVVLNFTPVPRDGYRIGVPRAGRWRERFSSDDARFGGSDWETIAELDAEPVPMHGHAQSLPLRLPPLGALVLVPA